jgi:acyl dehydratase
METEMERQRGLYFEEFSVGQKIKTPGRTITETDVVNFAGLSGDFMQIHTDADFSKSTPYGKRIAHGLLIMAVASGLAARTGVLEGTVLAFREINNWKFMKPVFLGDTIHVEMEITEKKEMRRIGAGAVIIVMRVINQEDEIVMKGVWNTLVALKPEI